MKTQVDMLLSVCRGGWQGQGEKVTNKNSRKITK